MNAIYTKLARIQAKIKGLARIKENKFQKYKYFSEEDAVKKLKPLLEQEKLAVLFTDDSNHFYYEKQDKEHILRYLKKVNISDGENEALNFEIWAAGQDPDISKAKGKAETYALKYFYSKFFMIPIVDTLDPDQQGKPENKRTEQAETAEEIAARHKDKITADEFLKKHGFNTEETKK
ncbi:Putative ERF-like recombinase [endosymbiont DhMRE of Dentiscutata heterogama]|uniref:ERF family protein n=1 Tax=endosymbiont DhMRE of Dentiscutata heterogama TaxID=1609546 RepID=UPI000629D4E9|nr:ERF family protein [endosymbiont DhMRE of Dentiscutata heterogama]CFW92953.1 Putative ERF-like recombinase [endosymbiont DhMRE of Dentiscutata heterogama]